MSKIVGAAARQHRCGWHGDRTDLLLIWIILAAALLHKLDAAPGHGLPGRVKLESEARAMKDPKIHNWGATDTPPLDTFSNCHVGILSQLDALGELPALLAPAARARTVAAKTLDFFREAVFEHHAEEERELFPEVISSAIAGEERDRVTALTERLTAEHRDLEQRWKALEPALRQVAKGRDADLEPAQVAELVDRYRAHAAFEEAEFLPLSQTILGRNSNHMAALGLRLHIRHAPPPFNAYI